MSSEHKRAPTDMAIGEGGELESLVFVTSQFLPNVSECFSSRCFRNKRHHDCGDAHRPPVHAQLLQCLEPIMLSADTVQQHAAAARTLASQLAVLRAEIDAALRRPCLANQIKCMPRPQPSAGPAHMLSPAKVASFAAVFPPGSGAS